MKNVILTYLFLICTVLCFGHMDNCRLSSVCNYKTAYNDSAKVAIRVKFDSVGKVISVVYDSTLSTNNVTKGMIEISKRKAWVTEVSKQDYSKEGTLIFHFTIVGNDKRNN